MIKQIDMESIGHFVHSNGNETLTIVLRVTLTEEINTAHMQTALEKAAQRYPNFHSVLASGGKGLVYELSNDKPVLQDATKKESSRQTSFTVFHTVFPARAICSSSVFTTA